MTRQARVLLTAVALSAVLASGCGGDDETPDDDVAGADTAESAGSSETTAEPGTADDATTTAPPTPEDEVLAAYSAAHESFIGAANPPNPDAPELTDHYVDPTLARLQDGLRGLAASGVGSETTVDVHPSDVLITGDTATLVDCYIDRSQNVSLDNGEPVGEPGETTLHMDVGLQRVDGVWKVADQVRREEPCTPG